MVQVEAARREVNPERLQTTVDPAIVIGLAQHACSTLITIPGNWLKQEFTFSPTIAALSDAYFRHNPTAARPPTVLQLFQRNQGDTARPIQVVLHHRQESTLRIHTIANKPALYYLLASH